jgi:three-Cys-motif partner protein
MAPFASAPASFITGDCNDTAVIAAVREELRQSLGLVFVDLVGLNVWFETIRVLTQDRSVDLVVTFPDMDLTRNATQADVDRWNCFFGSTRWRDEVERWRRRQQPAGSVAALLARLYQRELRERLGYVHSATQRPMVNSCRAAMYRPLFASRHQKGLYFWREACRKDRFGQRELFDR